MSSVEQQTLTLRPRRQRNTHSLLLVVALAAVFCVMIDEQSQLAPIGAALHEYEHGFEFNAAAFDAPEDETDEEAMEDEEMDRLIHGRRALLSEATSDQQQQPQQEQPEAKELDSPGHQHLLRTLEALDHDTDYDTAFQAAYNSPPRGKLPLPTIQPFTLQDAINESDNFEYTFAVLVYNPSEDNFVGLYSKNHIWTASNKKLFVTMSHLAFLLRKLFPERFMPDQPEMAFALGSGDYPHVKLYKLPHAGKAPVFEFGSSFRDPELYKNMISMPMPERHHLLCFEEWVESGTVCKKLLPAKKEGGIGEMVFGDEKGLKFEELIPQLIWRGSDFAYLPSLTRPRPIKPYGYKLLQGEQNTKNSAIRALRSNYDSLLPRWKAVTITAESEMEAKREMKRTGRDDILPWANIKFTAGSQKVKFRDPNKFYLQSDGVRELKGANEEELKKHDIIPYADADFTAGDFTSLHALAGYKYHIDIAGGGGTTWTGTIQKLAMPGLLFHHVTPTKDFVHDRLQPWRHYIPVSSDLSDLKSKFEWAESHPEEAKWIANQGTEFMRNYVSEEGYGRMFQEDFVEPLRQAIEAYVPVEGGKWMEAIQNTPEGAEMQVIAECSGRMTRGSCRPLNLAKGRGGVPGPIAPKVSAAAAPPVDNSENHKKLRGKVGTFWEVVGKQ